MSSIFSTPKLDKGTQKQSPAQKEEAILQFWKEHHIFEKSCRATASGPAFVFYEGPPTANGKPGVHHILSRVYKDIYIRYYTQKAYHVPRKAGWDCHGLPVEREVEKALGVQNKAEIEQKYGIGPFNELCRRSVLRYVEEWKAFSERMAFFIDLEEPYFTMDNAYIEQVWSLIGKIWEQGLIYQSYRVTPCDPVLGASMSDAEVDQGYKEAQDPSLTLRFALAADNPFGPCTYLLVWTTTPWTLPANTALALAPQEDYSVLQSLKQKEQPEKLICAQACLAYVFGEDYQERYKTAAVCKGHDLIGLRYEAPYPFSGAKEQAKEAWKIWGADFVSTQSGTGIVHIAPAYGADDLALKEKYHLPLIHTVGLDGKCLAGSPYEGLFFKDADKLIIQDLKKRSLLWKIEVYRHRYPFGYRTGAPLLYYAKHAWYIRTTAVKESMMQNNEKINWFPEHIGSGRFGNWLRNNRDWALSRERFWGTPLPIWTDGEGSFMCVSSRKELSRLCKRDLSGLELHRPWVDEIAFDHPTSAKRMRRVPEVVDCWFDSGAMPYAQWASSQKSAKAHLSKETYFPADFIAEAVDQTRGWFYTLLCLSTLISKQSAFKNVICLGHVLDKKGEKMSKTKANVVDPWQLFQEHGADAIRWYFLTGAPPGNARRISEPGHRDTYLVAAHAFCNMFRSSVHFFCLYAAIDKISLHEDWEHQPFPQSPAFSKRPLMDRWLLSCLQDLIQNVDKALQAYDCQKGGQALTAFLESLSNWYIRRNRRRFWKGALDSDKISAYDTLYRCLVCFARLLAPFAPFLAEEAWQLLVREPLAKREGMRETPAALSVHLAGWPKANHKDFYNKQIVQEGAILAEAVFLGRAARMQSAIKVRQPLERLFVYLEREEDKASIIKHKETLCEELNVKAIEFLDDSADIIDYSLQANLPRIGRKLGAQVPLLQDFLRKHPNPRALIQSLAKEKACTISLSKETEPISLELEDILVKSKSKEGKAGVEGKSMVLALETTVSSKLLAEGIARDIVRHIQELRKTSAFAVTDRIGLCLCPLEQRDKALLQAIEPFRDYIAKETLAEMHDALVGEKHVVSTLCSFPFFAHGKETPSESSLEMHIWKT